MVNRITWKERPQDKSSRHTAIYLKRWGESTRNTNRKLSDVYVTAKSANVTNGESRGVKLMHEQIMEDKVKTFGSSKQRAPALSWQRTTGVIKSRNVTKLVTVDSAFVKSCWLGFIPPKWPRDNHLWPRMRKGKHKSKSSSKDAEYEDVFSAMRAGRNEVSNLN
jgi:hypothetical protein